MLLSSVCLLAACSGATTTTTTTPTPVLTGAVTVSGTSLQRNGVSWTPHGAQLIAFVAAPASQTAYFTAAYAHYSTAEFTAIKTWGADTVRLQVSQPALDPQSSLYTAGFVTTVQNAVVAARAAGLNVIVCVQDESQSGETSPETLPNAGNQRVWQVLAPLFNGDTGILYEIMNEPSLAPSSANWTAWQTTMNTVIAAIRATGSKNVVIADGLNDAETLNGAPFVSDSAAQVAYAVHPCFQAGYESVTGFTANFGNFAASAPVIATEWSTLTTGYCDSGSPAGALALLQFLQSKNIGLVGYSYDNPGLQGLNYDTLGSIVQDFNGTPTTYLGTSANCGSIGFGPGTLVQNWYKTGTVATALQ